MPLVLPNIESSPTYDGQAVSDSTDWQASGLAIDGTGVISGCLVSPHTGSDMNISVAIGTVVVADTQSSVATAVKAIAAASSSDRRDIVIYTPGIGVETSGSGTTNSAAITGSPCGTAGWNRSSGGLPPVKSAVPSGSVLLAEVYVSSHTSVITSGNLIDKTCIVGSGGGGSGGPQAFPFAYNTSASLNTGYAFFQPTDGDLQNDWWVELDPTTPWNGLTPKFDMGFLVANTAGSVNGSLTSVGANPINLWQSDSVSNGASVSGLQGNTQQSTSYSSALATLGLTTGPPVERSQQTIKNSANASMYLIVSQDGTAATPVAASLVAGASVSFPFTASVSVNNNFNYNAADPQLGGGAASVQKFQVAAATYTTIGTLETAIMAATVVGGGTSASVFGDYCTVTNTTTVNGTVLVISAVSHTGTLVPAGAASNGNFLSAGNHDISAGLGFSSPGIFTGGAGGNPGSTTGAATLYLDIETPT